MMNENNDHSSAKGQQGKKAHMKKRLKGTLCAAFAAAGFACDGCSTMNAFAHGVPNRDAPAVTRPAPQGLSRNQDALTLIKSRQKSFAPRSIHAFGAVATPRYVNYTNWDDMLQHQKREMQDPAKVQTYRTFLDGFNVYAHEPLRQMAQDVNGKVLKNISYYSGFHSKKFPDTGNYWAPPIQTILAKKGDCKAYAILQYAIMRHLGVPENRLAVAIVNSSGRSDVTNHAFLMLNVAPAGKPQDFLVMNDNGPVLDASLYTRPNGANSTWFLPYVFFDAMNRDNVWTTPLENKLLSHPKPAKKPVPKILKDMPIT